MLVDHGYPGIEGRFVHPVSDPDVIAGNGTIGLEILEELPEADVIYVPYGGGGLSSGIACAVRALRPAARVFACEVETAAPFAASLAAGRPTAVDYRASFVDGIGSRGLLPEMWPLASRVLAGSVVSSLAGNCPGDRAPRVARPRRRRGRRGRLRRRGRRSTASSSGPVVCVVSGGNIDAAKLATILRGEVP